MNNFDTLTEHTIAHYLREQKPAAYDALPQQNNQNNLRQAAVLIPFVKEEGEWHLVFIRRSEFEHDRHSGQVAFAGGKYEPSDPSLRATALRETYEEIGIHPRDVKVLGQLNSHHSVTAFQITPIVGTVQWPYPLNIDEREVARVFTMPLKWLANKRNRELRYREFKNFERSVPVVYFKEYDGEVLWGATARMVLSLLEVLTPQPELATCQV